MKKTFDRQKLSQNILDRNSDRVYYFWLILSIVLIFGIRLWFNQISSAIDDHDTHIEFARQILVQKRLILPHFLYQLLVIIFAGVIPGASLDIAGYYLVPLLAYTLLGVVIFSVIRSAIATGDSYISPLWFIALTIALMLVAPINFFTYPNLYFGYIGINVYHNPTTNLVKPLSLLVFILCVRALTDKNHDRKITLGLSIVTTLSLIAKPSFLICLIPALLLWFVIKFIQTEHSKINSLNWSIILGLFLPAFLILAFQYILGYKFHYFSDDKTSIVFAPFSVISYYSQNLFLKLIASILFPLGVYCLYFKKATKNISFNLAWLTFTVSLFYTYFLAETGSRMYHGNFAWSSQLSLFILFFSANLFLLKQKPTFPNNLFTSGMKNSRFLLCLFIFGLHLTSGLLFYLHPYSF